MQVPPSGILAARTQGRVHAIHGYDVLDRKVLYCTGKVIVEGYELVYAGTPIICGHSAYTGSPITCRHCRARIKRYLRELEDTLLGGEG